MKIKTGPFSCLKLALIGAALLALVPRAQAAITASTYAFSSCCDGSSYPAIFGSTQLIGPDVDDNASAVADIGFDFFFDGVRYTQFSVNANGFCRLGPNPISSSWDNSSEFASTLNAPKIAPYYDDLWVGTNGKVHYVMEGAAPYRTLVIEWLNMQIPRIGMGNTGAGTFQLRIQETTGIIDFIYGAGMNLNGVNGGYTSGIQSGVSTNFASITSSAPSVSYTTANNTQSAALPSGRRLRFTPTIPAAPGFINFLDVRSGSMTVRWPDNTVSGAKGYVLYRSSDGGANFVFQAVTPPGSGTTSYPVNNLTASTSYIWRVHTFGEGGLSAPREGTQATTASLNISSNLVTGEWSDPASWGGALVPSAGDNVTINATSNIRINVDAYAKDLTVNGTLHFEHDIARRLTVNGTVGVGSSGILRTATGIPGSISQLGHVLAVSGNVSINGQLDLYTQPSGSSNDGATLELLGKNDAHLTNGGGTGTADLYELLLTKITSPFSFTPLVDLNFPNTGPLRFTVRGSNLDNTGFLTLNGGILWIISDFPMTSRLFKTSTYTIPAGAGILLDNPNFVVAGTASGTSTFNDGFLQITRGTYNVGLTAADGIGGNGSGSFIIDGGVLNCAGRFDPQGAVSYTQTGGRVVVGTTGNTRPDYGSFELFNFSSTFVWTGGDIEIFAPNTSVTPVDYRVLSGSANVGGNARLIVGTRTSPVSSYVVTGPVPNLTVANGHTMTANGAVSVLGTTVDNTGLIRSGAAGSRFDFASMSPTTYNGPGTIGTAAIPFGGEGVSVFNNIPVTLNANVTTNRINILAGSFAHSNRITLGNGGSSATTVLLGQVGGTPVVGSFDVSPVHNQGSAGQSLFYSGESVLRTVGFEVNPTRTLTNLTINNPPGVALGGADLTVTGSVNLTNGRIITGNNLLTGVGSCSFSRTGGWVDGNLRRTFTDGATRTFDVGSLSGYAPVTISPLFMSPPVVVTVKSVGNQHAIYPPGFPVYHSGLQRYWNINGSNNFIASLSFGYLQSDVVGNELAYAAHKYVNGQLLFASEGTSAPATDPVTNITTVASANINGDWLILDDDDGDGMINFFEDTWGFNSDDSADATADADGDGMSNLAEQFAGTVPLNASSYLHITSWTRSSSGFSELSFSAIANKTYRLEYKNNLSDANWTNAGLGDITPAFTGRADLSFTHGLPLRSYRVIVVP